MSDQSKPLSVAFSTLLANSQQAGAIRKIVELLASDSCTPRTFNKVCAEYGVKPADLKEESLDLVLYYVEDCLSDHTLTVEEKAAIRLLKLSLGIEEGDFYNLRHERVQNLLVIEIRRILGDKTVDPAEGLYQVDLQKIFDLSYDQWLELTRAPADDIVNALLQEIAADAVVTEDERNQLARQLRALDTVYTLLPSQRKKLIKSTT